NNAGILFFAKNPDSIITHAYVVCALYKGLEKVTILDRKDIKGSLIEQIEESILFLKKHINVRYEIIKTRRTEIWDVPEVALREAVTNAICHRDYFEKGAQITIEIFDDRLVISNPGGLPKGLDIKNFGRLSMARNPVIASLLQRTDYIEKMGTGINRIRETMITASLPEPDFNIDSFFTVTLKRESYIERNVGDNVGINVGIKGEGKSDLASLSPTDKSVLELLKNDGTLSAKIISDKLNKTVRHIERSFSKLKDLELISRSGSRKTGIWIVKK
ncbi:MAG: hypothetical protein KAH14_05655, partial [Clostridiales bacterium]|nr:hypothetical protein [Clostridiales bacterium]